MHIKNENLIRELIDDDSNKVDVTTFILIVPSGSQILDSHVDEWDIPIVLTINIFREWHCLTFRKVSNIHGILCVYPNSSLI